MGSRRDRGARFRETLFREREVDPLVVLTDMSLPDGNALDLLEESREKRTPGEWVFLTGYGSVPDSVRALRLGAFDFLEKPCELERLDMVVAGAARSARAQAPSEGAGGGAESEVFPFVVQRHEPGRARRPKHAREARGGALQRAR